MHTHLNVAIEVAKRAGDAIMELYATTDFEEKHDGSPVTIADHRSNAILTEELSKTGISILSEESLGIALPYPSQLWIIDPLDGTKDFLKKNGDFCVMVGLLEHGRPSLGVVYVPVYDELYFASLGDGAFLKKGGATTKLVLGDEKHTPTRCVRSINHFSPHMVRVAESLGATLHPRGSIGIKAGVVAQGLGDYFASWGHFGEWDVCAPEIIVTEAGGVVTDCNGNPLTYGTQNHLLEHGIIFANQGHHSDVLHAFRTTPPEVVGLG
jgi:3'(2'), 5'-bisphosphate nucleotidase